MHAVGAGRDREVGPVVQDEERAVLVAQRAEGRGGGEDLVVGRVLLAQLEHVHAARERLAQHVLAGARIGDEIEARLGESRRVGRHAAESSERRASAGRWCGRAPLKRYLRFAARDTRKFLRK